MVLKITFLMWWYHIVLAWVLWVGLIDQDGPRPSIELEAIPYKLL